jgi:hypothetical protein
MIQNSTEVTISNYGMNPRGKFSSLAVKMMLSISHDICKSHCLQSTRRSYLVDSIAGYMISFSISAYWARSIRASQPGRSRR